MKRIIICVRIYHGSSENFLDSIAPLLNALDAIGGLQASVRGVGVHQLGWLDSLLYASLNGLFSKWDTGEMLDAPLNYTAVS